MAQPFEPIGTPGILPSQIAPTPKPGEAPTPAIQPNGHKQADVDMLKKLMDGATGSSVEEAIASAEAINRQHVQESRTMSQQMDDAIAAQEAEATAAAPKEPKEKPGKAAKDKEAVEPAKKPTAKPVKKVERTPIDEDTITRVAADAAAKTAAQIRAQEPAAPERPTEPEMPEENQYEFRVWQTAEELNPKLKGISGRYVESVKKIAAYQEQWENTHPGQQFDDSDPEHNDFMERQEKYVGGPNSDFKRGERELTKREVAAELRAEQDQKLSATEQRLRKFEAKEQISEASTQAKSLVLEALELKAPEDADELVQPIVHDALRRAEVVTQAAISLVDGYEKHDPQNPLHAYIRKVTDGLLAEMATKPTADTANDQGQTYLDPVSFYKLPAARQAQHWTIGAADVAFKATQGIAANASIAVQKKQQEFEEYAKKRGYKPVESDEVEAEAPETPTETNGHRTIKPKSPSLGGDTKLTVGNPGGTARKKEGYELLLENSMK